MKVHSKATLVPISQVIIDRSENYRDEDAYKLDAMKRDLAQQGQVTPALFELIGKDDSGKPQYKPIQGFRRSTAISELAAEGVINPETGKPFDSVIAIIHENLSERDRVRLKMDHGQRRGLNKAELQRAFEDGFVSGYTEKELVNVMFGLLETLYPPTKKIEDTDQARLEYYRGVVQTAKRIWKSPIVLHEACMKKLRGEHKWPTNGDIQKLVGIFEKECEKNPAKGYNRQTPGPEFLAEWAKLQKAVEEATESGDTRPKSISMMNNSQVTEAKKVCDSATLKVTLAIVLRDIGQDKLAVLDKLLTDIETGNPDFKQQVLALFPTDSTVVEPTPETVNA